MKCKIVSIGTVLFIILACITGCSSVRNIPKTIVPTEMRIYESEQTMYSEAELIVMGTVESDIMEDEPYVRYSDTGAYESFLTISSFRVEAVLKGEYTEPTLNFTQAAAIIEGIDGEEIMMLMSNYHPLEKGDRYILYLVKMSDDARARVNADENTYNILGVYQGAINIKENNYQGESAAVQRMELLRKSALTRFSEEIK